MPAFVRANVVMAAFVRANVVMAAFVRVNVVWQPLWLPKNLTAKNGIHKAVESQDRALT